MRYFFGYAGVPDEVFEDVERKNKEYAQGAEFCIDKMPQWSQYRERNVDFFLERLHRKIVQDKNNSLADTAFAIIYIQRDAASTQFFVNSFFPHTLMIPVQWQLDLSLGPNGIRASRNALIPLLKQATLRARRSLPVLKDTLISHAATTPILLPVKNFDSKVLEPTLRNLHQDLAGAREVAPESAIAQRVAEFKRTHSPKRIGTRDKPCFVDDASIEFHPPGSNRHGYARAGGEHPPACVLSGRRRLGAPYDPLFHYDCLKGEPHNLKADLHGCHLPKSSWEGKPNINIAPNDNVNVRGNQAQK